MLQCTKEQDVEHLFSLFAAVSEKRSLFHLRRRQNPFTPSILLHDYCGPCGCSALNPVCLLIPVFGFDVGGVLVPGLPLETKTHAFGEQCPAKVVASDGAFRLILKLIAKYRPGGRFSFYFIWLFIFKFSPLLVFLAKLGIVLKEYS